MFNKKQSIILVILILILAGAIFLYQRTYQRWPWQKDVALVSPTATASPTSTPEPKSEREIVMEDVAQKIGKLSPQEPVLGGHWFVDRFWFIDGSNNTFYVEYEDGHIMARLLLTADTSQAPAKISYHQNAFFEPGESDWILKSGQDQTSGRALILFEFDQAKGRWVQKN
jgi:hypothetical protein